MKNERWILKSHISAQEQEVWKNQLIRKMKQGLLILFVALTSLNVNAQDSLFRKITEKSNDIVKVTILEIGRKIRFEDGIINYVATCRVDESFKGTCHVNGTIKIEITEYSSTLGGRGDSLSYNRSNFIFEGASLVFLLRKEKSQLTSEKNTYKPVDSIIGILSPNEQLLNYLRANFKTR